MTPLPCRPWIQYGWTGSEVELELELPQFPWNRGRGGVGGSDTAASGIVEAYNIRRDRIMWLRLRVLESEMAAFDAFLDWAQDSGEPFLFRFDTDVSATEYSVYLQSLRWEDAEEIQHERDGEYQPLFVIPLAIRTELGGAFNVSWHALTLDS